MQRKFIAHLVQHAAVEIVVEDGVDMDADAIAAYAVEHTSSWSFGRTQAVDVQEVTAQDPDAWLYVTAEKLAAAE